MPHTGRLRCHGQRRLRPGGGEGPGKVWRQHHACEPAIALGLHQRLCYAAIHRHLHRNTCTHTKRNMVMAHVTGSTKPKLTSQCINVLMSNANPSAHGQPQTSPQHASRIISLDEIMAMRSRKLVLGDALLGDALLPMSDSSVMTPAIPLWQYMLKAVQNVSTLQIASIHTR